MTDRERAYLTAAGKLYDKYETTAQRARVLAYRDAMEELSQSYPVDREARIFYALALVVAQDRGDKSSTDRLTARPMLEDLFAEDPTHSGLAHYLIQAYDVPILCGRPLVAARAYADIAPDAPHARHLPSHAFTRLGFWQESTDGKVAATPVGTRRSKKIFLAISVRISRLR
jgi:hypothetical protein